MNANNVFTVCAIYTLLLALILLDCSDIGSSAPQNSEKTQKSKGNASCPKEQKRTHNEELTMKMALCRPNISVVCSAKPNSSCFRKRAKLKTTAFVNRRNGKCLIESKVSSTKTLRFYVEAKRVINANAEGSRSLTGQHRHQRGKCLLKYICDKRYIRSITMECGSVLADEEDNFGDFQRQRTFWVAPSKYKDFVHFSAEMTVSSEKRVLNISSAKIFIPDIEQDGQETSTISTTTMVVHNDSHQEVVD